MFRLPDPEFSKAFPERLLTRRAGNEKPSAQAEAVANFNWSFLDFDMLVPNVESLSNAKATFTARKSQAATFVERSAAVPGLVWLIVSCVSLRDHPASFFSTSDEQYECGSIRVGFDRGRLALQPAAGSAVKESRGVLNLN
jgi:hypothetical protein